MSDVNPSDSSRFGARSLPAALAWVALYVAGQWAAFRLTALVPFSTYPHLQEWSEVITAQRAELAVLLAQTLAVVTALFGSVSLGSVRKVIAWFGAGRAALLFSVIAVSLAIPTRDGGRFATEVVLAAWIVLVSLANLVLLGRAVPPGLVDRATEWLDARVTIRGTPDAFRRWDRAFPWVIAGWVLVVSASMAWFVFEGVPHIDDSVAYLFQAKTFALGRLSVLPPVDTASFEVPHLVVTDHAWFSKYFPGWPALLSLGVAGRVAWLVNPLLAAATVLLAHALLRRVYDRGVANVGSALMGVSPWLLTSSGEMMSHPAALFFGVLALLAIERQRDRRIGWWAILAGLALGMLYLVRPPDAAALGVVAALWAWGVWGRRLSIASLATVAAVAIAVAAVSLPYNAALTGDPFMPPHRYWSIANFGPNVDVFGFGPNIGIPQWRDHDPLPGHGPVDVALNTNRNLFLLSTELFGWGTGSLWLLLLGIALKRRWRGTDGLMLGIVAAVGLLHMAYWYPGGPDFGPRFWYLMLVPLAVFTAHGAAELGTHLSRATGARYGGGTVGAVMVVASLTAVLAGLPWRAAKKYHRYREIGADVRSLASGSQWSNALVFVHSNRHDYQAAFNFQSPTLEGEGPIFAFDVGPQHRNEVLRHYPHRPVWIIGRSHDGARLVILGGPFPPGQDPRQALQALDNGSH
jgi:hypothetical protein